jgi:hypothetical protein
MNDNYKEMFIYRNKILTRGEGRANQRTLDDNFFSGNIPALDMGAVSKLKFKDFFQNGDFKSLDELNRDTRQVFSLVTYMRLRESMSSFIRSRNRI